MVTKDWIKNYGLTITWLKRETLAKLRAFKSTNTREADWALLERLIDEYAEMKKRLVRVVSYNLAETKTETKANEPESTVSEQVLNENQTTA